MQDRIQKRRTPAQWLVARDAATREEIGLVMDLTLCGVRLLACASYDEGAELHLAIETPDGFDGPPEAQARAVCRWCKPAVDDRFDVGLDITVGITDEDLRTVATVFYRHSA